MLKCDDRGASVSPCALESRPVSTASRRVRGRRLPEEHAMNSFPAGSAFGAARSSSTGRALILPRNRLLAMGLSPSRRHRLFRTLRFGNLQLCAARAHRDRCARVERAYRLFPGSRAQGRLRGCCRRRDQMCGSRAADELAPAAARREPSSASLRTCARSGGRDPHRQFESSRRADEQKASSPVAQPSAYVCARRGHDWRSAC